MLASAPSTDIVTTPTDEASWPVTAREFAIVDEYLAAEFHHDVAQAEAKGVPWYRWQVGAESFVDAERVRTLTIEQCRWVTSRRRLGWSGGTQLRVLSPEQSRRRDEALNGLSLFLVMAALACGFTIAVCSDRGDDPAFDQAFHDQVTHSQPAGFAP